MNEPNQPTDENNQLVIVRKYANPKDYRSSIRFDPADNGFWIIKRLNGQGLWLFPLA